MKKIVFVAFISVFALVAWVTYPQIVQKYRENFAVNNVTVVLHNYGENVTTTVIGTLKIHEEGSYYLEVTDIPDYYFNKDGKILIKVDRFGYEKPAHPIITRGFGSGRQKRANATDFRLCTKAEAIKLIDVYYGTNSEKNGRSIIESGRFPNGRVTHDNIIKYPEGKKPFFNYFNNRAVIPVGGSKEDYIIPDFKFIAPGIIYRDLNYDKQLPQAESCFVPYKVKIYIETDTDGRKFRTNW